MATPSTLVDLVRRDPVAPWRDGGGIPWTDPEFSRRMLDEHLSQQHDMASRRAERIDEHVAWIHSDILGERPTRLLDLGCGPGLYANRLARLGHDCTGVDFSPASIQYARQRAEGERLPCVYVQGDLRTADLGGGYRLVMMISGELNVFRREDAVAILRRAHAALGGGTLLLEAHTVAAVRRRGALPPTWRALPRGLFSDRPHVWLREHRWEEATRTATTRHFVVDAETGSVETHAETLLAYSDEEYHTLLRECGFAPEKRVATLAGEAGTPEEDFIVLVARRNG